MFINNTENTDNIAENEITINRISSKQKREDDNNENI